MATKARDPLNIKIGGAIKAARDRRDIPARKIAEAIGTTVGAVGNWESGQNAIAASNFFKVADFLNVDARALALGELVFLDDQSSARNPVIRSYDPDNHTDHESDEAATFGSVTGVRGIPEDGSAQLDVTGGLGAGGLSIVSEGVPGRHGMTFAAEQIRDYWRLPPAILITLGLAAHDVAIIPVQGDSMLPTLNEGDVVFIDTRHRLPSPPGLYAILDEIGGVVIKRLEIASAPGDEDQIVSVISDNPRHAPKQWRAEQVQIIGRVLRKFGTVG